MPSDAGTARLSAKGPSACNVGGWKQAGGMESGAKMAADPSLTSHPSTRRACSSLRRPLRELSNNTLTQRVRPPPGAVPRRPGQLGLYSRRPNMLPCLPSVSRARGTARTTRGCSPHLRPRPAATPIGRRHGGVLGPRSSDRPESPQAKVDQHSGPLEARMPQGPPVPGRRPRWRPRPR